MGARRYAALLRGINVGGRNRVAMADLRAVFESGGYAAVRTHIQSGNVLFETETPRPALEDEVEALLERRLGLPIAVVVRSHRQLRNLVRRAPHGFGGTPDTHHFDVIFLRQPLTPERALRVVELRDGVDAVWTGPGALYFARLSARRTQSRMSAIVGTPEYQRMTIRNWSTTTKVLALLDDG